MPSASRIMVNWCISFTWNPVGYAARTATLKYKAQAGSAGSTDVVNKALAQTQDMDLINPVTLGTPFLDPDQSW